MNDYKDKIKEKYKKILFIHGWGFNHKIWEKFAKSYMPIENCFFLNFYDYCEISGGDIQKSAIQVLNDHNNVDLIISWSLGCHLAKEIEILDKKNSIKKVYVSYSPKFMKTKVWKYGFEKSTIQELKSNLEKNFSKTLKNFYLFILGDFKSKAKMYKEIILHLNSMSEVEIKKLSIALDILEKSEYINYEKGKDKDVENLYIYGDRDIITPPNIRSFLRISEPLSRVKILSNSSHIPFVTNPEDFYKVLKSYI